MYVCFHVQILLQVDNYLYNSSVYLEFQKIHGGQYQADIVFWKYFEKIWLLDKFIISINKKTTFYVNNYRLIYYITLIYYTIIFVKNIT